MVDFPEASLHDDPAVQKPTRFRVACLCCASIVIKIIINTPLIFTKGVEYFAF